MAYSAPCVWYSVTSYHQGLITYQQHWSPSACVTKAMFPLDVAITFTLK